ncbi:MAG: ParB N-terminal domain-containing protein [Spirochaetes bacterium]|nr:ParB N-terminal domain-containing protein [Spirochaetota bacterium]
MKKLTTMQVSPKLLQPSPELLSVQHLFPWNNDDLERTAADIRKNGIRDAIKVYQNADGEFFIIGGLTRHNIALEINMEHVPIDIYEGTTKEYTQLAIDDNYNRRHISNLQKRAIADHYLGETPELSDHEIARKAKVDHKTVSKVRKEKEAKGEIPKVEKRVGKDEKVRGYQPKETGKTSSPPKGGSGVPGKWKGDNTDPIRDMVRGVSGGKAKIKCPHCGKWVKI